MVVRKVEAVKDGPIEMEKEEKPKDPHAGCVKRTLNFRDRDLILQAVQSYCSKEERADWKFMNKLRRVKEALSAEECADYFDTLQEHYNQKGREKANQIATYNRWMAWYNSPSRDESKRPEEPKGIPSLKEEKPDPKEMRGKERDFWILAKIDSLIQDAIKAMKWNTIVAEYVTELCEKYGFTEID